ncbi:type II toxin-antitoxin system PemK/MazF family toxin [Serinicoccus kebangsaanensis]|uniref:type II toxin-antitoxin system PemK/MazF family toxin n=1 Tax=Serinicoccus kebangsaanensis TaxID=2602069 RepID=UPI00124C38E0|nr:type II toxin-antitoxin system PemK/MazF family toxin [Serinicoccus kebangsaanensis]
MDARRLVRVALRAARVMRRTAATRQSSARPDAGSAQPSSEATLGYAPVDDDKADPGEVVWAWVPYEEDASQGKDRPVLVVGREGPALLALQLTSQDHDRDAEQEAAAGRYWMDVGAGDWDHRRRPSEARVNRLLRLDRDTVRRTGARLDQAVFERVVAAVREHQPGL